MNAYIKMAIAVVLMTAIGIIVVIKNGGTSSCCSAPAAIQGPMAEAEPAAIADIGLPQLVELGSTTCIPCKMMKPILDELEAEYAGTLKVVFIDVHQQQEQAARFNLRVIPTQVFLDASGKELFRHEGFYPKEEIEKKLKEIGVQ